jgi:DNA-directed RNA polymerase specialized sigma24 family protein
MERTFEELIGHHLDDLYSAALCFTLDEHRAEELLEEASIRAFHEFSRRRHSDFRRAMLETLVSTFLQRERQAGRDPLAKGMPLEPYPYVGPVAEIEPFPAPGTPGYKLLRQWMTQVWSRLDDGERLILWLADVERVPHATISRLTGLDGEDVRARHYRARQTLSRGAARHLAQGAAGGAVA